MVINGATPIKTSESLNEINSTQWLAICSTYMYSD